MVGGSCTSHEVSRWVHGLRRRTGVQNVSRDYYEDDNEGNERYGHHHSNHQTNSALALGRNDVNVERLFKASTQASWRIRRQLLHHCLLGEPLRATRGARNWPGGHSRN
jgi:hypothetical protein